MLNNRWFQLVASLTAMIMIANLQYAWTLFVQPLREGTGWALPDIQFAFTLFILFQTWVQPLDGWFIDRLGPRGFITAAGLLCGLGWAGMGYADSLPVFYVFYCAAGTGAAFVYSGCIGSALKWFKDKRGLAAGIMAAGFGGGTALFIPIIIGAHSLYPWTHEEVLRDDPVVKFKQPYLNLSFFTIRAVIIFGVWLVLAFLLNRWSLEQDRTGDRAYAKKMRVLSGPGMVLLIFGITFASVDWYMSLEPEWFSTIFGLLFFAAWGLSALAFTIAVMAALAKIEPMNQIVAPLHFHDLGKLLLALVMLWAYFAFSQFLIIWSGNLPEEIRYYLPRMQGILGATIIVVGLLHFAAPFLFLLSRSNKRNPQRLVIIALVVLIMRVIDLYWVLKPAFFHNEPGTHTFISWMDIVSPIAIGGIWLWFFLWQLGNRALIPINDPQFESTMEQQHASGH